MQTAEIVDVLFKVVAIGLGVWAVKAWLKQAVKTPQAKEGFLTLKSLQEHCATMQKQCIVGISAKFEGLAQKIGARLAAGDKLLDDHEKRLRDIQTDLTKTASDLRNMQNGYAKAIANHVLKQLRAAKRR